jgi:hypothetical protein
MSKHKFWSATVFALTIASSWSAGCSSDDPGVDGSGAMGGSAPAIGGTAGSGAAVGGAGVGGAGIGGAGIGGAGIGGAGIGGAGIGGAGIGGAGIGGAGAGGSATGGATSGGSGGVDPGAGGTSGGTGGAQGGSGGGGTGGASSGPSRSMGYVGCSMSVNVAQGYQALGGMRLWQPIQAYNGKVVQSWTNNNDSAWQAFEQQMNMHGTPSAVWVMICIFENRVTYDETKQIIANVRQRAPNATIYITGQPLYAQGLSCELAGDGGPELTDDMALMAGADASQNVIYGGTFGPLTSSQRSDSCHANGEGQRALGQQAIDKWGS